MDSPAAQISSLYTRRLSGADVACRPAPGMRPSLTSGWPDRARGDDAIVSGDGWFQTAAKRGTVKGHDYRLWDNLQSLSRKGSRVSRGLSPETILGNSLMSAPAMKVEPAPMTTMAWTCGSAAASAISASMP